MRRTPVRYALWSMLVIAPTMVILPALIMTLAELRSPLGADTGPLTAVVSVFALLVTAFVGPAIVLPEGSGFPGWSAAVGIGCLIQLFAILCGYGGATPTTAALGVHVPAAIVCLNLAALIVIHAWVASAGMGCSPAVGLATGLAYSLWLMGAGTSQDIDAFMGMSSALLIFAFALAIVAAFVGSAYAQTATAPERHGSA